MPVDIFEIPEKPERPAGPPPVREYVPRPAETFNLSAADVDASGAQLAKDMEEKGYQPVILLGNSFSGKTSVLLSLLALLKIEPALETGISLENTLLPRDSRYGRYQMEQATAFFNRKVQDFIEGKRVEKTALDLPFFVPVSFRPSQAPSITFAFMESNGEWYKPDRNSDALHPALKAQIEDFIRNYQGGIIFLHLLPYTQQAVASMSADPAQDSQAIIDAELAIAGTLRTYQKIRIDKSSDMHLMLITKWDAHQPDSDRKTVLTRPSFDEIRTVATVKYSQVQTSFVGLGLEGRQKKLDAYCAGLMSDAGGITLNKNNLLREIVLEYPKNLWMFLYKHALRNAGLPDQVPFPQPPPPRWWEKILDRYF